MKKTLLAILISSLLFCGCGNVTVTVYSPVSAGFSYENYINVIKFTKSLETNETETEKATESTETSKAEVPDSDQPALLTEKLKSLGKSYSDITYNQLILVVSSSNTAKVYCYDLDNGKWTVNSSLSDISGYVGKNGVSSSKKEGDNCSPVGVYALGDAFGILDNPGTSLNYRKVTNNSYFVDDTSSSYYNTWVESDGNLTWSSAEHMIDHNPNYNYGVIVNYNMDPIVPGNGSAIFLHCGTSSTAGCVAVSQDSMKNILLWLRPGAGIIIT